MTLLLIAAVLLAVVVLLRYARPGDGRRILGRPASDEARWEEKVLLLTRGDRGALERAVTGRRRKHPHATRAELLKMVHDEYVRDRG